MATRKEEALERRSHRRGARAPGLPSRARARARLHPRGRRAVRPRVSTARDRRGHRRRPEEAPHPGREGARRDRPRAANPRSRGVRCGLPPRLPRGAAALRGPEPPELERRAARCAGGGDRVRGPDHRGLAARHPAREHGRHGAGYLLALASSRGSAPLRALRRLGGRRARGGGSAGRARRRARRLGLRRRGSVPHQHREPLSRPGAAVDPDAGRSAPRRRAPRWLHPCPLHPPRACPSWRHRADQCPREAARHRRRLQGPPCSSTQRGGDQAERREPH